MAGIAEQSQVLDGRWMPLVVISFILFLGSHFSQRMQVATHCETGGAELRALETGDGGSLTPGSGISTLLPP
jgi:hypothetical protein